MNHTKLIATFGLAAALAVMPSAARAQGRPRAGAGVVVGHAAPRTGPAPVLVRPSVVGGMPYRPYFRPGFNLGFYYGYPGYYGAYGYPYGYPYGYGYPSEYAVGWPVRGAYGGVRIALQQRNAEVYADGYYAGIVDNFDGALQHLDLQAGPHHIEVRAQGFQPIAFDVNVEPGRTITYRTALQPLHP